MRTRSTPADAGLTERFRQSRDDLDLELEAVEPGDAHRGQRGMGCLAPVIGQYLPDAVEDRLRIDEKHGHVDYVVEGTARRLENFVQIVEGTSDLGVQLGLRRAVLATAYLARNEQEAIGTNGRGISVAFIERLAPLGKNDVSYSHDLVSILRAGSGPVAGSA